MKTKKIKNKILPAMSACCGAVVRNECRDHFSILMELWKCEKKRRPTASKRALIGKARALVPPGLSINLCRANWRTPKIIRIDSGPYVCPLETLLQS